MAYILKIFFNPFTLKRDEQLKLLRKLKGVVGQFTTENRIYDTVFLFRGQDIQKTIASEIDLIENPPPEPTTHTQEASISHVS